MKTIKIHYDNGTHKNYKHQTDADIIRFYKNATIEIILASEIAGFTSHSIKPLPSYSVNFNDLPAIKQILVPIKVKLKLCPQSFLLFEDNFLNEQKINEISSYATII